ncbi:E3 ubiquitin protein ligase RIE1-like isoform X2 [Silene latifolia]|uniref:E3 ubiquitin protein ligase RIE1-like isoform X2 n=1 Tax=Silene latifolia TaxID=37657 RepID=UPI003D7774A8
MAISLTTLPVILCSLITIWGPLAPSRESLMRQMEDSAYSKDTITLEIITNILFISFHLLMSAVTFLCLGTNDPSFSVRVWVSEYLVRYLLHLILVWFEYRRVSRRRELELQGDIDNAGFITSVLTSFAYCCEFFYLPVPLVYLNVALNWVKSADKLLLQHAQWLYLWFTRAFLAYDVTFAMIWLAGITACCGLPCFILILRYRVRTVAQQEGAHMSRNLEKPSDVVPMDTSSGDRGAEHVLLRNSACCICRCSDDDGKELHVLRCSHHFHLTCIEKWLKVSATCPVCNAYNCRTLLRRYSI